MFISRKTLRLKSNKNKIANSQLQIESANPIQLSHNRLKTQLQIVRYPIFYYFIAMLLIPVFVYLIYSSNGGGNGIPGFNQRLWWQYILSFFPLIISSLIFIFCEIQSVLINRDKIDFSKAMLMGFKQSELIERQVNELMNVSIIKRGVQRITFTNSSYFLVFNFRGFEEVQALECASQINAVDYLEQIKACLPHLRGSIRKISIRNVVEN